MPTFAPQDLTRIVQAILLAARQPLNLQQLAEVFEPSQRPSSTALRQAVQQLQAETAASSQELIEVASGFRYQIKAEYAPWVSRLWEEKPQRYSRALLETLALIAYRQPITRGEIEEVRGVSVSSQIIRTLEEREWIKVIGYREVPGRPALFATTRQFLDYFNLPSLNQLPELAALRELASNNQELWEDELDQPPISPLLAEATTADADLEEATDPHSLQDLLTAELPAVSELTFADLAARFNPETDKLNQAAEQHQQEQHQPKQQ